MAINDTVQKILISFEDKIGAALEKSLMENDRVANGILASSLLATTKVFGQTVVIEIHMEDYGKFVNEGVDGTSRSVGSRFKFKKKNLKDGVMLKHIADRGERLNPIVQNISRQYKNSKDVVVTRKKPLSMDKSRKTLAFLLGRKIAKQGLHPTNFVKEGLDTILPEMEAALLKAVGRQIKLDIKQ